MKNKHTILTALACLLMLALGACLWLAGEGMLRAGGVHVETVQLPEGKARLYRPEIIRGQLSEAFTRNPKYRKPSAFASEFLLFDGITKPDFIAYNAKHWKNPSRIVTRKLFGCPAVAWTIQSPAELDAMRPHYDLFIFEGFLPETESEQG